MDATGAMVATATGDVSAAVAKATLKLPTAQLWSIARPYLYTVSATIVQHGADGDSVNASVGVRSLRWDANSGFFLNGQHSKIRGFCDHNDFGGVGMAVPDRIKLYRAQQLRSVGGNGRRMSHNPPQASLLDIYDRLGVLVMDENRVFNDDAVDVKHMADLVRRDRNHPSVFVWNFCNEGKAQRRCALSLVGSKPQACRWLPRRQEPAVQDIHPRALRLPRRQQQHHQPVRDGCWLPGGVLCPRRLPRRDGQRRATTQPDAATHNRHSRLQPSFRVDVRRISLQQFGRNCARAGAAEQFEADHRIGVLFMRQRSRRAGQASGLHQRRVEHFGWTTVRQRHNGD